MGGCEANLAARSDARADGASRRARAPAVTRDDRTLRGTGRWTERARRERVRLISRSAARLRTPCTNDLATRQRAGPCQPQRKIRRPHWRRTSNDEEQGGGTVDLAMLAAIAGWEAAGAAVARTHCRIPFRVRCNGRDGGVGGRVRRRDTLLTYAMLEVL